VTCEKKEKSFIENETRNLEVHVVVVA